MIKALVVNLNNCRFEWIKNLIGIVVKSLTNEWLDSVNDNNYVHYWKNILE